MHPTKILVQRIDADLPLPAHATAGDAGVDLFARRGGRLQPGERDMVPTGIAVAIPDGYVGLVCPRSGLAVRSGVSLVNGPGVIDSGYRGELHAVVVNLGDEPFEFARGDRIAQLVVVPFVTQELTEVSALPETQRGTGGFGSTGT